MAKAGQPLLFDAVSGKVSNRVFVRTRFGTNIRVRIKPANPQTVTQQFYRDTFSTASQAGKNLAESDVVLWKTAAANITKHNPTSGEVYEPSWFNYFTELAYPFLLMNSGGTAPTSPPTAPFNGDEIIWTISATAGTLTLTADRAQDPSIKTFFSFQKLVNPNRTPMKNGYRIGDIITFDSGPPFSDSATVSTGTYAVAIREGLVATGQLTPLLELGKIAVP